MTSTPGVPAHPERRGSFGAEAERYDRVRPRYPVALFDRVAAFGGLRRDARVIEIGPGTGIATAPMLERGWRVTGVELDPAMAAVLRARLGDAVEVRVGGFEEQPPPAVPVDLVLCATAFHWLPLVTRVPLVARALRAGGTAAIVWTRHVDGGSQAFFDAARDCYERFGEEVHHLPPVTALEFHSAEFERSPEFDAVERHVLVEDVRYGTADYLDLLRTYSDTAALDGGRREALLGCIGSLLDDRFGGRVVKRYAFELVLARRR